MMSCSCNKTADECKECCLTSATSCTVFNESNPMLRSDGTLCSTGFCENEKCVTNVQDVISRFWEFITHLSVDSIGIVNHPLGTVVVCWLTGAFSLVAQWIRDNIVGAVLIFSVLVRNDVLQSLCCVMYMLFDIYYSCGRHVLLHFTTS